MKSETTPVIFGVCSTSDIKLNAVKGAVTSTFRPHTEVKAINAESGINEQPVGEDEILKGSMQRAFSARKIDPSADVYISMENGIDLIESGEDDQQEAVCVDYAIVLFYVPLYKVVKWEKTRQVIFPIKQVLATQRKPGGFTTNTVGQTLFEHGIVSSSKDPHFDICGDSRETLLREGLTKLFRLLPPLF